MENIKWLGHASFVITDEATGLKIYYIDPYHLPEVTLDKADLIFVTHAHHDHLSEGDINKVLKPDTTVVATPDSLETLKIPDSQKFSVEPNSQYSLKGLEFETVPAYNINPEKLGFHPKSNNWVGYILSVNGKKIYHAGDTDFIPEMREFAAKTLDFALIPIGGTYTMGVDEAIEAANAIGAKITVPMHYRGLLKEESKDAEKKFKNGVKNSKVMVFDEVS